MNDFSRTTKRELLLLIPSGECCRRAELLSMVWHSGNHGDQEPGLFKTKEVGIARKLFHLASTLSTSPPELSVDRKAHLYRLRLPLGEETLNDMELQARNLSRRCCRRAYLRGAFISSGWLNDPRRSYHLELACPEIAQRRILTRMMRPYRPRVLYRNTRQSLYLKDGEGIVRFLQALGAHSALLRFEDTRVYKEIKNQVNRLVNAETANLNRVVDTSFRQGDSIRWLAAKMGLDTLPRNLRQVAELRLKFPDLSYKELGQMFDPPLTKSGVRYRLVRLEELAIHLAEAEK